MNARPGREAVEMQFAARRVALKLTTDAYKRQLADSLVGRLEGMRDFLRVADPYAGSDEPTQPAGKASQSMPDDTRLSESAFPEHACWWWWFNTPLPVRG